MFRHWDGSGMEVERSSTWKVRACQWIWMLYIHTYLYMYILSAKWYYYQFTCTPPWSKSRAGRRQISWKLTVWYSTIKKEGDSIHNNLIIVCAIVHLWSLHAHVCMHPIKGARKVINLNIISYRHWSIIVQIRVVTNSGAVWIADSVFTTVWLTQVLFVPFGCLSCVVIIILLLS